MKLLLNVILVFGLATALHAQEDNSIKNASMSKFALPGIPNLKVGDTLPDFVIPEIIRGGKAVVRTSDFKDQLLILDFWATGCPGCVEALPKMQALQKQFGDKIKIDETGYKGDVSMALNIRSWTDIPAIRKALNAYGLDLKEEEREVDKFVFSEVNGGLLNKISKTQTKTNQ